MLDNIRKSLAYWGLVLRLAASCYFAWSLKQILSFLLAVIVLLLQFHYHVINEDSFQQRWLSVLWPYVVIFGTAYLLHVGRAAWRMHEDVNETLANERRARVADNQVAENSLVHLRIEMESRERDWSNERTNIIDHCRLETEAKERDWNNERTLLVSSNTALSEEIRRCRARTPSISLQYEGVAQFGAFCLCNTGDVDATNIQVSNIVLNNKFLCFRTVSRIKLSGESIIPELSMHWVPQKPEDHDGAFYFGPLSPDRGKHKAALEWLIEDNSPELQPNDIFHSDVM